LVNLFDLISCAETALFFRLGEVYLPLIIAISFIASLAFVLFDFSPNLAKKLIVAASVTQILAICSIAPEYPNHRFLAALINISLLYELYKNYSLNLSENFVYTAKFLTTLVYGFAFFHKLNIDYLDPSVSCASQFTKDLMVYYPGFEFLHYLEKTFPWIGLLTEGFLALIFFLPSAFSVIAVAIGFIFHSFLALHIQRHFFDFSSLMMTLLLLFVPSSKQVRLPAKVLRWFIGLGFLGAYILLLDPSSQISSIAVIQIRSRIWLVFAVLITYIAYKQAATFDLRSKSISFKKIGALNFVLIALAFISGITPYLGLKTRYAFDMYSNLLVEDHKSNHFVIPSSLQARIFTDDLVDVVKVKNIEKVFPRVRPDVIVEGERIVRFQLMAIMARAPELAVSIVDNGVEREITDVSQVYSDGWVAPWIVRKIIGFRPVKPKDSQSVCQW
jgi:hypothetical protein